MDLPSHGLEEGLADSSCHGRILVKHYSGNTCYMLYETMERKSIRIHQCIFYTLRFGSMLTGWTDMVCAATHYCILCLTFFSSLLLYLLLSFVHFHDSQFVFFIG